MPSLFKPRTDFSELIVVAWIYPKTSSAGIKKLSMNKIVNRIQWLPPPMYRFLSRRSTTYRRERAGRVTDLLSGAVEDTYLE